VTGAILICCRQLLLHEQPVFAVVIVTPVSVYPSVATSMVERNGAHVAQSHHQPKAVCLEGVFGGEQQRCADPAPLVIRMHGQHRIPGMPPAVALLTGHEANQRFISRCFQQHARGARDIISSVMGS
jgi:hypothetical protein